MPVPAKELITRAVDLFVPDGQSMVIASWAGPRLHTCVALRRMGAGFDMLLGPDELRRELGPARLDLRSAHRKLCALVEQRLGRVSLGLSADTAMPDFELWTMLRAWAGFGAALRGRSLGRPNA